MSSKKEGGKNRSHIHIRSINLTQREAAKDKLTVYTEKHGTDDLSKSQRKSAFRLGILNPL